MERQRQRLEIAEKAQAAFQIALLNEAETSLALEMIDMRNLTVHAYDEILAEQIFLACQNMLN